MPQESTTTRRGRLNSGHQNLSKPREKEEIGSQSQNEAGEKVGSGEKDPKKLDVKKRSSSTDNLMRRQP